MLVILEPLREPDVVSRKTAADLGSRVSSLGFRIDGLMLMGL